MYCRKTVSAWAEGRCYYGAPHSGQGCHEQVSMDVPVASTDLPSTVHKVDFPKDFLAQISSGVPWKPVNQALSQISIHEYEGKVAKLAGVTSKDELAMFLANVYHERATLPYVSELNAESGYST
ncbi:hypothetical protein RvY_16175 [Ramazzottius varieornatus]|uniref:Uncharacterized protein n=1 Tax=Ramazzottius varieornatus TaxID=947166 RepID=A0A1D1W417_RAMVA|nr:hypothetical protein RvY_16175 [Ramazzottius varieornatus]